MTARHTYPLEGVQGFISPTERYGGTVELVSSFTDTESFGADFAMVRECDGKRLGIQRKLFPSDLEASIKDGRLAKQINDMTQLDHGVFVFQGEPAWTENGTLVSNGSTWSTSSWGGKSSSPRQSALKRSTVDSVTFTLQAQGYGVTWVRSDNASLDHYLRSIAAWWAKPTHSITALKPVVTGSGKRTSPTKLRAARMAQALQVVPGIGAKTAAEIATLTELQISATREELETVKGLGPKGIDGLLKQFGGSDER